MTQVAVISFDKPLLSPTVATVPRGNTNVHPLPHSHQLPLIIVQSNPRHREKARFFSQLAELRHLSAGEALVTTAEPMQAVHVVHNRLQCAESDAASIVKFQFLQARQAGQQGYRIVVGQAAAEAEIQGSQVLTVYSVQ